MEILVNYINKDVTEDSYEEGEIGVRRTVLNETVGKKFDNFEDMIEYFFLHFDFPGEKDNWIAFDDGRIVASRMENDDGYEVTADDSLWNDFSDGLINLWAADFDIMFEFITTHTPNQSEIANAFGIDQY